MYIFIHTLHTIIKIILLTPKTTWQNKKKYSQFLKKKVACRRLKASLRSAYLLQSEIHRIMQTLSYIFTNI